MARFGINPENTFGVSLPNLRKMAKEVESFSCSTALVFRYPRSTYNC
ncbi:MAG: hypothetical protein ACUVV4_08460 [Candidatus Bathyarchaeia archaeon]